MKTKYNLIKKNNFKNYLKINSSDSYNVNKRIDKESLGTIKFYDNDMINIVIKKKIDAKFKKIINLMIKVEEDDSDPSEGMVVCLNELDKLNKELINKYKKFLQQKQMKFLEKKIILLENEIKMKLFNIQIINNPLFMNGDDYSIEENEKESSRRR